MPRKKTEPEPIIFPDHYIVIGSDLSLRRPGFCILSVRKENGETKVKVKKLLSVDNKTAKKKSHGELLDDIRIAFVKMAFPIEENTFLVRENEILKQKVPSERSLSKVVGLMDWLAWNMAKKEWYSVYPMTIKKYIAGSGKAEKSEVAVGLEKYIGKQEYKCDDESDAAAVAVAWLVQQGELKELP